MPRPIVKTFAVHKPTESPKDCQDAYAINSDIGRYAIADGVMRSFYPAEWARLLVEHFCNEPNDLNRSLFETKNWQEWLAQPRSEWETYVNKMVKSRPRAYHLGNSLMQREPAGATFVGLQLDTKNQLIWNAMIIGDSCLFCIREELASFLLKEVSDFGHHPQCFSSIDKNNEVEPSFISGKVQTNDIFILATDALAKWILYRHSLGTQEWVNTLQKLLAIKNWDEFYKFVSEARQHSQNPLEEDDTTLIIVAIEDDHAFGQPYLLPPPRTSEPETHQTIDSYPYTEPYTKEHPESPPRTSESETHQMTDSYLYTKPYTKKHPESFAVILEQVTKRLFNKSQITLLLVLVMVIMCISLCSLILYILL